MMTRNRNHSLNLSPHHGAHHLSFSRPKVDAGSLSPPDMDFSLPAPKGKMDSATKEQLLMQVKQQIAFANAQQLLQKMSDKCYRKCVSKSGTSLDKTEQKCIAMCMDRYMEVWNLVSRTYGKRLQTESNRMS